MKNSAERAALAASPVMMLLTPTPALLLSLLVSTSIQYTLTPQYQVPDVKHTSAFTRLRDRLVTSIWTVPERCHDVGKAQSIALSNPPGTIVSRYKDDVVLRFTIGSEEEARALREAAHVLFLDIWDFTAKWADIRLATDVVGIPRPSTPTS